MLSPSPTQPPPVAPAPEKLPEQKPEQKIVHSTLARKRIGEAPAARFVKGIFRPVFKGLYFGIQSIRRHKILALLGLVLILISIFGTTYFVTKQAPLSSDQNAIQSPSASVSAPQALQNWVTALRKGDLEALQTAQKDIPGSVAKPDITMAVLRFSESQNNTWTGIKLVGASDSAQDGSRDWFVEIDMTQQTSAGPQNVVVLWHFTTIVLAKPKGEVIYSVDYISTRPSFK